MGHLLRWRELLKSASELTEFDISDKRKEQFSDALVKAEKVAEELKKISEGKGLLAILARAVYLNVMDFISKVRETRFVSKV
jgi:hypothetical protein